MIKKTVAFIRQDYQDSDRILLLSVYTNCETEDKIIDSFTKGVTKWVDSTKEGAKAWKDSCEDFNIGDLLSLSHENSTSLLSYLKDEGINSFEILYEQDNTAVDYDTVLFDYSA